MNVNNHKYIFIQCQSHRTLTFSFHRRLVSAVQANIRPYPRIKIQKHILCVFVLAKACSWLEIAETSRLQNKMFNVLCE
jgi:hypothetical protein